MRRLIKKFIPSFIISWYHFGLAFFGSLIYGFPSKRIKVIGITGTNGKSTVVYLAAQVLQEAGFKVAALSSIKFKVGEKEWPNKLKMTMPGRFVIQSLMRRAVREKCQYFILEVTSEGIKQYRHKFIDFSLAVFTNLSPEHIEAHKGFENYKKAKGELFKATKGIHIINAEDENANYFLQFPAKKKYTYGLSKGDINNANLHLSLLLPGDFNIANALAAIAIGVSQGANLEICKRAVEKVKVIPGRMEEIVSFPFKVVVDYAFTPNALEKVYQTLKPEAGKLICVLGACGGGRDKWKRPVLGGIAARYCQEVIVTNEDPYDEDPTKIIEDVAKGIKAEKILDRREAVKKALTIAKSGDTVIITGKGSEPWICLKAGKKIAWDDREVVREEFSRLSF
jgi:UDP-N-acetylmuramoyl-L-alanyl-D-glutamate--2,6-diaminopimelate ligase